MRRELPGKPKRLSRRDVVKTSGVVGTAALLAGSGRLWAGGSDRIRLGLIACGGRGTYDTTNCLNAAANVELVAMGDMGGYDVYQACRRRVREEQREHAAKYVVFYIGGDDPIRSLLRYRHASFYRRWIPSPSPINRVTTVWSGSRPTYLKSSEKHRFEERTNASCWLGTMVGSGVLCVCCGGGRFGD